MLYVFTPVLQSVMFISLEDGWNYLIVINLRWSFMTWNILKIANIIFLSLMKNFIWWKHMSSEEKQPEDVQVSQAAMARMNIVHSTLLAVQSSLTKTRDELDRFISVVNAMSQNLLEQLAFEDEILVKTYVEQFEILRTVGEEGVDIFAKVIKEQLDNVLFTVEDGKLVKNKVFFDKLKEGTDGKRIEGYK